MNANLPQSIHNDARYQTVETVGAWDIRCVPYSDPSYNAYFRADCLPVQLVHRPTGISILTATRRTCGKFEAMIPQTLQGKSSNCCRRCRTVMAMRSVTYEALRDVLQREYGVVAPDPETFSTYALTDRPGPKEAAGFNAS